METGRRWRRCCSRPSTSPAAFRCHLAALFQAGRRRAASGRAAPRGVIAMNYEISHRTSYRYQSAVTQSQHLIHLAPRIITRQTLGRHVLPVEPTPSWRREFTDYFGNPAAVLGIEDEHQEPRSLFCMPAPRSKSRHGARSRSTGAGLGGCGSFARCEGQWPRSGSDPVRALGRDCNWPGSLRLCVRQSFVPGRTVLAVAWDLDSSCRIFDEFTFDSEATDVSCRFRKC